MVKSDLVSYVDIIGNSNNRKNSTYNASGKITKITIHHMAGNISLKSCANALRSNGASANYGIDSDGNIALFVSEDKRSWASSSRTNDYKAVTIEVANDGNAKTNWHVSDKAIESLINLCVDICKRNDIEKLNYTGNANGNLTRHNMFTVTTCPGAYLQSKFSYIAEQVNKRLDKENVAENEKMPAKVNVTYRVRVNGRWLPPITNCEGYAGNIGQPIDGFMVKTDVGSIWYQAHLKKENRWLGKVTGYNEDDFSNGYAGNNAGDEIDAIRVYFKTPSNMCEYCQAHYRVSELNENYMDWQEDNSTKNGMDGYAGNANGKKSIDRIQIKVCPRSEA